MQLLSQWKGVSKFMLTRPATFFAHYDEEHGVGYPMIFLAISLFVVMLPVYVLSAASNYSDPVALGTGLAGAFALTVVLWVFTVIEAGIAHLLLSLFGASGYSRTLEAYAFPSAIRYSLWWVPILGIVPWFVGCYLQARGLAKFHDVSEVAAAAAVIVAVGTPFLLIVLAAVVAAFLLGLGASQLPQPAAASLAL